MQTFLKNATTFFSNAGFIAFFVAVSLSFYVGQFTSPTWTTTRVTIDAKQDDSGNFYYIYREKKQELSEPVSEDKAVLSAKNLQQLNAKGLAPSITEEVVFAVKDGKTLYYQITAKRHWQIWSLLPAFIAIVLCWWTREPITALSSGVICGVLLVGDIDVFTSALLPNIGTANAATILILYLWFLGGLLGIWAKTGASLAFAEYVTKKFVRGPKSAKLVAWFLGVIFFQGGTISAVLVGTTVKPIADKEKVSHEELSLIVDSTSSPIAAILAFNAWPGYVQAFLYVSGVAWLATEQDRVDFFFRSIPYSFYALFAVISTFLVSIDKLPSRTLRAARERARDTGALDAPGAEPLSSKELELAEVPGNYAPHMIDFLLPLFTILGIAIGTYIASGTPQILSAFGISLVLSMFLACFRGMKLRDVIEGMANGWKGVVLGSVILLLAICIGNVSKNAGGGAYLVDLLGSETPYYLLPAILLVICIVISFSTGTSWGTMAVTFPLGMPLSYAIAVNNGLADPQFYMMVCFATILNGSIFGDQCSPISDTTILSSMCTGCDLMDHVKSQIPVAVTSMLLALICWTVCVVVYA
ncbi:Na+/H+ antiporter NhaC family protein [Candidatus Uabimicrobium amorphum]|uniref:Sodium:proton antiporter n=1 Tax=Uabimicrobium amorphum TaxID=2596890 RepID=A0A5S9IWQ2_UABAM|nr:Na+/H+ antiporter NhaC family protein [Candidatus Uabimicrobium amorphum]BBM87925.1 sodium:proton antiporter [Candidatus Uabimicrobium amorphum]